MLCTSTKLLTARVVFLLECTNRQTDRPTHTDATDHATQGCPSTGNNNVKVRSLEAAIEWSF